MNSKRLQLLRREGSQGGFFFLEKASVEGILVIGITIRDNPVCGNRGPYTSGAKGMRSQTSQRQVEIATDHPGPDHIPSFDFSKDSQENIKWERGERHRGVRG
jgi:hypothetical protein